MDSLPLVVQRLASLRRAKDLIDRDFAEPLDLDDLAHAAGYSRYHFTRSFKQVFGRTPREYLSWRRIERARDLLRTANLTVTEVCMLVGFSSLGTFSSRFTAVVGVSPAEFRRQVAVAGGAPPIPGCFVLMWNAAPEKRNPEEAAMTGTRVASRGRRGGKR